MNIHLPNSAMLLFLGLGFILFVLGVILAWTTRISFRLRKVQPPKVLLLFASAFFQILLGVGTNSSSL